MKESFSVETKVFTNGDIEFYGEYSQNKIQVGSFLITKKIVEDGEILILESIEIDSIFRGKGLSKKLTREINSLVEKLKNEMTLCFTLEIFPFKYSPLKADMLELFYKREFGMEYIGNRIMIKEFSFDKDSFKEKYSDIFE